MDTQSIAESDADLPDLINNNGWATGSFVDVSTLSMVADVFKTAGADWVIERCQQGQSHLIVLTQWCDLAIDEIEKEPNVEFILAESATQKKDAIQFLLSYRALQLECKSAGTILEFNTHNRVTVSKAVFRHLRRDSRALSFEEMIKLTAWIGSRYKRVPLPNALVRRMSFRDNAVKKSVDELSKHLFEIRANVTPNGKELKDGERYTVVLYLISKNAQLPEKAAKAFDKFKSWANSLQSKDVVVQVHLKSGDEVTYSQMRSLYPIDLDAFTYSAKGNLKGLLPADMTLLNDALLPEG
ncbi:hypothetical protein [Paraburkholderia sp. J63]|uniref:hypothetical protein n=1 Tax=Paraburkholderia sp. J63 TaxID=2805434 RepID=UPI002ABD8F8C|nr:hypothetical protein [Paraburkholderia sp. J63]